MGDVVSDPIIHKIEGLGHRQIDLIKSLADEDDESTTRDICLIDSSARGWAVDVSTSSPRGIEGTAASLDRIFDQLNDVAGSERVRAHRLAGRIRNEVFDMLWLLMHFGLAEKAIEDVSAFTGDPGIFAELIGSGVDMSVTPPPPKTWREYFDEHLVAGKALAEAQRVFNDAGSRLNACRDRVHVLNTWARNADEITPFTGENYDEPVEVKS